MKVFAFFVFTILISFSCSVNKLSHIPHIEELSGFDFSKYSEKGFLITPYSYENEYEPVGLLKFIVMPEANRVKNTELTKATVYSFDYYTWEQEIVNPDQAIEGIYNRCIELGANALVDFRIDIKEQNYVSEPPVLIRGYEITGFAIKRK